MIVWCRNSISFEGFPLGFILLLITFMQGDVLGDFEGVTNDVGYLNFNATKQLYTGNLELPEFVEGVRIERRTPSRIIYEDYIDHKTGKFRADAILAKMLDLAKVEVSHFEAYCREREEDCEEDSFDVYTKWQHRRSHLAYRFAYDRLKEAFDFASSFNTHGSRSALGIDQHKINEHLPDVLGFRQALIEGLEAYDCLLLDYAGTTKRTNKLLSILNLVKHNAKKHHIKSGRAPASNLLVPDHLRPQLNNQTFFSPEQLASYSGDLSLLDPPNSGFWRKPHGSVSSFNTTNYNRYGVSSLAHSLNPDQIETVLNKMIPVKVVYEKDDLSGRTPKVSVKIGDQKWKLKYVTHRRDTRFTLNPSKGYQKRWLGSEVNVEPVVNNLAAAIGYTVDPTYYQEKVHLYFGNKVYRGTNKEREDQFEQARQKMIEDLTKVFPSANIQSAFENVQRDDGGRLYLEVREATLEKKSDRRTDLNIGYYMRGGFGKSFKREFRAFSVFLAWIADSDIKDANVKAKLVPITKPDGSSSHRMVYSASDMGGALGTGFPNLFKKDFIKTIKTDDAGNFESMQLTYRSIFPAPLLKVVSFDDFRWIARMIGQLTRAQIYDVFSYAGYPEVVAHYYAEILLRRRDQLVRVAELMGEQYTNHAGETMTYEPLSNMTNPREFTIDGYEEYFKKGKLRDKKNKLFDPTKSYFPRYWGTKYPMK